MQNTLLTTFLFGTRLSPSGGLFASLRISSHLFDGIASFPGHYTPMFLYQVLVMAHVKRWWLGRNRRALKTIVQRDMWAPLIDNDNDADAAAVDRCHRDAPDAWSNSKAWTYIDGGEQGDGDGYDDDALGQGLPGNVPLDVLARLPDHRAQQRPAPATQSVLKATAAPREVAPKSSSMVPRVRHPAGL